MQLYLAVRSFEKREAFLYRRWYGRVANKPYTLQSELDHDFQTHFTVTCYDPDEETRSQQVCQRSVFLLLGCASSTFAVRNQWHGHPFGNV